MIKDEELERFLRYVKIDTQSNPISMRTPSEEKELNLSKLLLEELKELGIEGEIDEYGRLYAFLPGEENWPIIGLNSHVDTATELSGANVKPQIHENYKGENIQLNEEVSLSPQQFPKLLNHIGDTLITTDGTTLLGGDDKAGIAIIMSSLARLKKIKKHAPVAILFTPDEEIGRGPEHFNHEKFKASWAYTVDGDAPTNLDYENFNGAHADIEIKGLAIHPGEAKGKLINALTLASIYDASLPNERPETTEGYEGFYFLQELNGSSESCSLHYIIRDHSSIKIEERKKIMEEKVAELKVRYPKAEISIEIHDDYKNMAEVLKDDPRALIHARKAFESLKMEAKSTPIRGGTDGATFSFLGCPTPNLGTGSYNHHGRYEYLSLRDFKKMIDLVTAILTLEPEK